MIAARYRASTNLSRINLLLRVARDVGDLHTATVDQLSSWLATHGKAPATTALYHCHLTAYYDWCVLTDRLVFNPMRKIKKPRVPKGRARPTPRLLLVRICAEADERWRRAAVLAAFQGLRACEIAQLRRDDVTEDELLIREGKGGKSHIMPTHASVWAEVKALPAGVPVVANPYRDGAAYNAKGISAGFARHALARLGAHMTMHQLRHWYGSELRRRGHDLRVVQQAMRHTNLNTTEIYTEVVGEELRVAIQSLPPAA